MSDYVDGLAWPFAEFPGSKEDALLVKQSQRSPGEVCLQGHAASIYLCSGPAHSQPLLSTRRGTWERARPSSLHPVYPPWRPEPVCRGKLRGIHSYQVWRGGLGLRSVIIHVQIDQDFSCSPYSTGHFPYCQLPKSRGRGDRDKGKAS